MRLTSMSNKLLNYLPARIHLGYDLKHFAHVIFRAGLQ